ncbi:MAG: AAA family ATPase [Desulfuromonadaceae bacterium]|nr:AAA family ATPase [Desulfuromonadaceae bacterium]
MILRRIELKNFACFSERSIEFRRGLNLITGSNESGKSTLLAAVVAVLFGLRDKQRYRSWGRSQLAQVGLLFEEQGQNFHFERDFSRDQIRVQQSNALYWWKDLFEATLVYGSYSETQQQYSQLLRDLLGVSDESLFRASLFAGQNSFPQDEEGLSAQLRVLFSGLTSSDSGLILRALKEDCAALTNDVPWYRLSSTPRQLETVEQTLLEATQQHGEQLQIIAELDRLYGDIALLQQDLAARRDELKQGRDYLDWIEDQWQQRGTEEQLLPSPAASEFEPGSDIADEIRRLEQQLGAAGLPTELPAQLPELLAQSDDIRQHMVSVQSAVLPLRQQLQSCKVPSLKPALFLSVFAIVLAAAGWWLSAMPGWLVGLSVCSALSVILWLVWGWRYRQVHGKMKLLREKIAPLQQQRDDDQFQLQQLDDDFERLGFSASAVERVRLQKQLLVMKPVYERLSLLRQGAGAQTGGSGTVPVGAVTRPEMREAVDSLSGHLQPEDLPGAMQRLQQHAEALKQDENRLLALLREEAVLLDRLAPHSDVQARIHHLSEEKGRLAQRKQVLLKTVELLDEGLAGFQQQHRQRFEDEIGHYLKTATKNYYRAVQISDGEPLQVKNRSGSWIPINQLSRGTFEVVCLSIRLALSRFVSHGKPLPFFLDDALINLDGKRLVRMVDALERLASDHQLILASHDERLQRLAAQRRWHVINLDETRPRSIERKKEGSGQNEQLSLL